MHIQDILAPSVIGATFATSGIGVTIAARRIRKQLSEEGAPLVGVLGAFVFAAQMVNFPIPGSSAHLGGATLLTVLLGPSVAIVTMTAVLLIQAFLFQDGGISALGANIWNLGIVPAVVSHGIYRLLNRESAGGWRLRVGAAIASYVGLVVGAVCAGVELELSGYTEFFSRGIVVVFAWIGVGEALATVLCIEAIRALAPGVLQSQPKGEGP